MTAPDDAASTASAPPPGLTDSEARRGIITVTAATIFLYLSLYLYVPFLPLRAAELGASNTMIGLVIAGFAVGQVVLRLPIGIGADLIGRRKPFAVGSLVLATVGGLGLALAPNTGMLFAARLLTGASVAGWVAITVLFASYYRPDDTAKAMSRIMTVWAAGLVLGTFAGGVVADLFGSKATFWGSVAHSQARLFPSVHAETICMLSHHIQDNLCAICTPHQYVNLTQERKALLEDEARHSLAKALDILLAF